jgi:phosphatidylserine/phosphatidylglycerophosphate/cardiolipin synthase-like enzyme
MRVHLLMVSLNSVGANLEMGGPRQPWHDIHSKVEGAAAWDVFNNFEQRWRYQAGAEMAKLLVDVNDHTVFIPPSPVTKENDVGTWNVQLFRSIDSSSVEFPTEPESTFKNGLIRQAAHVLDKSIQVAPTLSLTSRISPLVLSLYFILVWRTRQLTCKSLQKEESKVFLRAECSGL